MWRSRRWSAHSQSGIGPWKYDEVLLGHGDRLGFVVDGDVDDAVGHLHVDRADLFGREHAEPAALDHRRAAHADVGVFGGDDHVAAAEQRGVAGEAATRGDADRAARGRTAAPCVANVGVSSGDTPAVAPSCRGPCSLATAARCPPVPARPPPPSAKSTTGSCDSSAISNMRSVFGWLCAPCVPASTV